MDSRCKWFTDIQDRGLQLFFRHLLQRFQLLSVLVHQHCSHVVNHCGWHTAGWHTVPHSPFPLPFLAAAKQRVVSKVEFGWSTSKSYYLLIGFILVLLCLIANCLSCVRSTMRCLSAALWAFCVQDTLFACDFRFCLGKAASVWRTEDKSSTFPPLQYVLCSSRC